MLTTITGSLQMYALVCLSICVLTSQADANQAVSNRNHSGEIESRITIHPKKTEMSHVEPVGRSLKTADVYGSYSPVQTNRRSYPYRKSQQATAQDRFHPTTYEEAIGEGEVVEVPSLSFDSAQSGSDQSFTQDSYVQAAFDQAGVPQGSDNGVQSDSLPADSLPDPQVTAYSYGPPSSGGYDYQPPPPPPTKGYYYLPPSNQYLPSPPSNQYLPIPPKPEETRQTQDYTYYYLGPKLWYIPLWFSVYFVLYVGALIIKAIAKHKIIFPQQMFNAATSVLTQARSETINQALNTVMKALTKTTRKYSKAS